MVFGHTRQHQMCKLHKLKRLPKLHKPCRLRKLYKLHKLYKAQITLASGDSVDVSAVERLDDELCKLAAQEFARLPRTACNAHIPLLQTLHQMLEVQESTKLLMLCSPHNQKRAPMNEITALLNMWQSRKPNSWDDITAWDNLLLWRLQVFKRLHEAGVNLGQDYTPVDHMAHTLNKLARVAQVERRR